MRYFCVDVFDPNHGRHIFLCCVPDSLFTEGEFLSIHELFLVNLQGTFNGRRFFIAGFYEITEETYDLISDQYSVITFEE